MKKLSQTNKTKCPEVFELISLVAEVRQGISKFGIHKEL